MGFRAKMNFWQHAYLAALQGISSDTDPHTGDENEFAVAVANQAVIDCETFWESIQ